MTWRPPAPAAWACQSLQLPATQQPAAGLQHQAASSAMAVAAVAGLPAAECRQHRQWCRQVPPAGSLGVWQQQSLGRWLQTAASPMLLWLARLQARNHGLPSASGASDYPVLEQLHLCFYVLSGLRLRPAGGPGTAMCCSVVVGILFCL